MKIYKYRDFSNPTEDNFRHLAASIHRHLVWCARPDTLNDPEEFIWACDYSVTPATLGLLAEVIVRAHGRTHAEALVIAERAIKSGNLVGLTKPVIAGIIAQCRAEVGLAGFGTAPDNETLWERYGGNGAGICIEFLVPDAAVGTQFHRVLYPREKWLHFDQLLSAFVKATGYSKQVYELALLSKPSSWASEDEIRFVSQRHSIQVALDKAQVPCVFLGDKLKANVRERIQRIAGSVLLVGRGRH
jgi:hypothetical protein